MHKQRRLFTGGLLYGLIGYIVFNVCLAVASGLVSMYAGTGMGSLFIGAALLSMVAVASAGLVILIGGRMLHRFGFEASYYYALFGLILVWVIARVIIVVVPMYILMVGMLGVFSSTSGTPFLMSLMAQSVPLSIVLTGLISGMVFLIIATVRKRTKQPAIWLIGMAVVLFVIGTMSAMTIL